jgi:hypothetical protein
MYLKVVINYCEPINGNGKYNFLTQHERLYVGAIPKNAGQLA